MHSKKQNKMLKKKNVKVGGKTPEQEKGFENLDNFYKLVLQI